MAKKKSEPRKQTSTAAPASAREPLVAAGQVVLTHPKLDREITVRAEAVPHYKRSGWRVKRAPKATDDVSNERLASNADDQPADTKEN